MPSAKVQDPGAFRRPVGHPKGRQVDPACRDRLRALLGDAPRRRDLLIEHLHRIQDAEGCLSSAMLAALAEEMRLAQAEVFEVASFYHHFDIVREGEARPPALTVRVCDSLSCTMAGAEALLESLPGLLGPEIRVQRVPCVGRCDQAPVAIVDRFPVGRGTLVQSVPVGGPTCLERKPTQQARKPADQVREARYPADLVIDRTRESLDEASEPEEVRQADQAPEADWVRAVAQSVRDAVNCGMRECPMPPARRLAAYRRGGGYGVLAALFVDGAPRTGAVEDVLLRLEESGLRGLGGAGFPAARKWRAVSAEAGPRMLVVNADEGEPGTFKDRHCLETDPHRVLEGMLIAAVVVGCDDCYIYLRDEYAGVRALLERELGALAAAPPVPGVALPRIHLRRGAGSYICGEESALIESLEGKRGMPRLRPPYVAQVGLFGRPTLAHNVETLDRVTAILSEGADAYAVHGRRGRRGLRLFSVSGRVRDPGVKCVPAGISLRELVDEHCGGMADGRALYAFLPGGASGGILPASLADLPLDFDTLQPYGSFIGSAGIVVLSQEDRARDVARNLTAFFRYESCGKCTPCRVGTAKSTGLMQQMRWDLRLLDELAEAMGDASICGLGQAAPNPFRSVVRWFAHELEEGS